MDIKEEIDRIFTVHKDSGLYEDSFENTIYKFTNAFDFFYLDLMRRNIIAARQGNNNTIFDTDNNLDNYRHSYRACVKFICQDCKKGNFVRLLTHDEIKKYQAELFETINFNLIRNTIDRYKIGQYNCSINNEGKLCFTHKRGERSLIYDSYSRYFANQIPGSKNTIDNLNVFNFNLRIVQLSIKKQHFESKKLFKPPKNILLPLIKDLMSYFSAEVDEDILDFKANGYCLKDYLLVYCYLTAIGIFKTAYLLSLKHESDVLFEPSIIYPKETLINDIGQTTGVSKDAILASVKDMIFDYAFHRDRVTIFQPLFEVGEYLLCSSNMLFYSYAIDKIMKYYDINEINKQALTKYHKRMSDKMNNRMADFLPSLYLNLQTFKNCKLSINNETKAEVDLILFDKYSKKAALIELKNYTPVENELDATKKENRINQAISSRLEKDGRVLENLKLFFDQNGISEDYTLYDFRSLIITNSFIGGVGIKETIKVVDEALFYFLFSLCKGNLESLLQMIEDDEFFKILEEHSNLSNAKATYNYKGLTVFLFNK